MPLRVLVTGFDPFGSAPTNPSGDAAVALEGTDIVTAANGQSRSARVHGVRLPVVWELGGQRLTEAIESMSPSPRVVISLGEAEGASTFRVEQTADNRHVYTADYARPRGNLPPLTLSRTRTITLPTALPRTRIEHAIEAAGGHVIQSTDAGGFICNEVFFTLMQFRERSHGFPSILRAGFIHVPDLTAGTVPPVTQDMVNRAIHDAVVATIEDLSADEYRSTQP